MSQEFYDRQAILHAEITQALIAVVPAGWDSAVLELDLFRTNGSEHCARVIYHPDGEPECIPPSPELIASTDRLVTLWRGAESVWKRATFGVWKSTGVGWETIVRMTY